MTAKLAALAQAATPGPWGRKADWPLWIHAISGERVASCVFSGDENAAHIAAWSPERALAALAVIEAAREANRTGSVPQPDMRMLLAAWDAITPGDV